MRYLLILLLLSGVVSGREPNTRTPGETAIVRAETAIAKDPNNARAYCALAMAHAKRARETAEPEQYRLGLKAVERSLELEPENYEARRSRVWLLLGQHEFAKALEQARELNKTAKDDILVYGFLADANVELGNYDEAETAAQWMLDLRPGNVAGLTRGAYLREIYGDL